MRRLLLGALLLVVGLGLGAPSASAIVVTTPHAASRQNTTATPSARLSIYELKYALLEYFGTTTNTYPGSEGVFFCDAYLYPIGRPEDEKKDAIASWENISKNKPLSQAILTRLDLLTKPSAAISDGDKLAIHRECRKLSGTTLDITSEPPAFTLSIRANNEEYISTGTITWQGQITIREEKRDGGSRFAFQCPLCLPSDTRIETPSGTIPVKDLAEGGQVWTQDAAGRKVAVSILRMVNRATGPEHRVVNVTLADGRTLTASPGHPLTDGRSLVALKAGDVVDGSTVVSIEAGTDTSGFTYDLLPDGDTGFYWADGILIASSLSHLCY
jgi:hypothetical protein